MQQLHIKRDGFTLIELSVVLVIIGLIVGGILIGQELIGAAGTRATIAQIEKYNTAANTFYTKFNYLPGDIPAAAASSFGLAARGQYAGEGDGDGNICGVSADASNSLVPSSPTGETGLFWEDMSTVKMIEGGYNVASATQPPATGSAIGTAINGFLPTAKLGNGNFLYVWCSGASTTGWSAPGSNYFGLSAVYGLSLGSVFSTPALTENQAFAIDTKIDDGLPQSGRVLAMYIDEYYNTNTIWAATSGFNWSTTGANYPTLTATAPSSGSCYDNSSVYKGAMKYSTETYNGNGLNCALSIRMQGEAR